MTSNDDSTSHDTRPWWFQPELAILVLLVVGIYFTRLTAIPIVGEECRWARTAAEMLETGDWIVSRQQGQVFPERPPLGSWAMAIVGLARGKVDDVAVRLPSVIAVLLTSLTVYAYARGFLSRFGALAAGTVYATMGHVLQLGRLGESEALFTLFITASLLVWHMGYMRGWLPVFAWASGYAFAAMGALVKGPQAPVYFVAVTGVYLVLRREWRWLFSWSHVAGIATFAGIISAWQIPYYLATDWNCVTATWGGLAGDRFILTGLAVHLFRYPMETLVCLLPWSPLLIILARRRFRESLGNAQPFFVFLVTALAVTYPSVWFAALARGRYFMPLYPCVAALIGLIIDRSVVAAAPHRGWNRFLVGCGVAVALVGVGVVGASVFTWPRLAAIRQPLSFAVVFGIAAALTSIVLFWARRDSDRMRSQIAVVTFSAFLGLCYTGAVTNYYCLQWNLLRPKLAKVREHIPDSEKLVSFGPLDHRFAYYYETSVPELPWPTSVGKIPSDVTYFCFNRYVGDTDEEKQNGRGRSWRSAYPGTLPIEWEEVAVICCDRKLNPQWDRKVVVGRIIRTPSNIIAGKPSNTTQQR